MIGVKMGELTRIKKFSEAYNILSDLNEYELLNKIENKMKKEGYVVCVVRNKYKFKYGKCK